MQLSYINNYNRRYQWYGTILEGYLRTYDFDYQGNQVTDQRPKVVSLGRWRSDRGNNLLAGINLNYLSPEQVERLQKNAQKIVRSRNLQRRVRTLRSLMPDIFNSAYRTYYQDAVDNVEPGTLRFLSVKVDKPQPDPDDIEPVKPKTDPHATLDADDVVAPQIDVDEPEEPEEPEEPDEPDKVEKPKSVEPEQEPEPSNIGTDEIEADTDEEDEEDREEEITDQI